jgi:hypothetical protein
MRINVDKVMMCFFIAMGESIRGQVSAIDISWRG